MERTRIDKWLWAARFFKTRSLASAEVDRSRVKVNGLAVKPAHAIRVQDAVQVVSGATTRDIRVLALSEQRGPASAAALLYEETAESLARRALAAEQRRLAPEPGASRSQGRPTKRERRDTDRVSGGAMDEP